MIQSVQTSTAAIETKAPKGAVEGSDEAMIALEEADFATELQASIAGDTQTEVQPVQISVEQMLETPTKLLNPQAADPDALHPKMFDPGLTKGVEQLTRPQAGLTPEQILQLEKIQNPQVKEEVMQAMLKIPQVQMGGRAPAIDFAKTEIDPKLMNMEDFVAQKNLVNKKNMQPQAYGMQKSSLHKMAIENGLKQTQIVKDPTAAEGAGSSPMNSQQFILNMMNNDQGQNPKLNETQAAPKVFDMSNIKSSSTEQIINQISDYIVQAKAAKEPTVSMRVNHEELGMIDITVQKTPAGSVDAVAVSIGTHSADGKSFFQANSRDLFSHLSSAGLNISDLKIDVPSQTAKSDFDFGQQSGQKGFSGGQDKQFGSEQNQRRHDSEKRQELWKQFTDKEAA